jgi:hypothetical protein
MSDIYEDIRIVVQRHREQAAAEERAKIVAYLWNIGPEVNMTLYDVADAIEAKEHLK